MSLLLFLLFGFLVGLLARALMPGSHDMGFLKTALLGMGGSLVGGFLTSLISDGQPLSIHKTGLIGSVIGAMVVLALVGAYKKRN
jgi:uncharacterized membrane protein YeaQ/YmgE (transglycosylase-associated protein family)